MAGKFEAPRNGGNSPVRRRGRRRPRFRPLVLLPIVLVVVVLALLLTRCGKDGGESAQTGVPQQTAATEQTEPPLSVTASATVASQGDMLMHSYIFTGNPKYPGACYIEEGVYNFDSIFQYVAPYVSDADYAVANLETTFGGDGYKYGGNPLFNCPDALADSFVSAGYDMLLTANNHCSDTTTAGLKRTLEQIRSRNLASLGTQLNDTEKKYAVVDINGIKIGMLCYTYASGLESDGSPNMNFRTETIVREAGLVNYFTESNLDRLYSQVRTHLSDMKAEGAEATILYIHWGAEYEIVENSLQRQIAQQMCDLGIDVIIGGHPHVIQPMDLLTSSQDPQHKTVCIYSLGNAVSNQRIEEMKMKTGHTEDGALFSVTFEKYSDGTVAVAAADVLPTWVNKFSNSEGKYEYNILPLDMSTREQWKQLYSLNDTMYANADSSYSRTMDIVGAGLEKCQTYLEQARQQRLNSGASAPQAA